MRALTWKPVPLALVVVLALACAGGSAPSPAPAPTPGIAASNLARLDSAMPERVDAFTLVERRRLDGVSDMAYHYRDGSPANVSVYLYPANHPRGQTTGSAGEQVAHEGAMFLKVMPIQVRRGVYSSFDSLASHPDSLVIDGVSVPGYVTEVRAHRGAATALELQFLHVIGGDYVKLRATAPESRPTAQFRALDSAIVARLVRP